MSDPAALEAQRARYDAIFEAIPPPFAFVDLDAMRANADEMLSQAAGKPIRVASKSVRSVPVLRRIFELSDGFAGILAFTLPEALWLAGQGFEDVVVAYPSADRDAIRELVTLAASDPDGAPIPMVDDTPHLDLIEGAMAAGQTEVKVCMEVDAGWWPLGGRLARVGPKRSPIHEPGRARAFAAEVNERPGTRLAGLMAYEGQIAGVGDDVEGQALRSAAVRWMQSRSEDDLRERLPRIVEAVTEVTPEGLEFVNAGGTGSLARTAAVGPRPSSPRAPGSTRHTCSTTIARSTSSPPRSSPCRSCGARRPGRSPPSAAAIWPRDRPTSSACPSRTCRRGCASIPRRERVRSRPRWWAWRRAS